MKLPTIPPGKAGKNVKYCLLSEPIRLQDFEDFSRSQAWKKIKNCIEFRELFKIVRIRYMLIIKTVLCITRLMPKVSLKLTSQIILSDVLLALREHRHAVN